tara:strand:- start:2791 stop:2985 length:195 start_codon:yes stop_codon:yes gene_type:complete
LVHVSKPVGGIMVDANSIISSTSGDAVETHTVSNYISGITNASLDGNHNALELRKDSSFAFEAS